jgi:hypothetical protein
MHEVPVGPEVVIGQRAAAGEQRGGDACRVGGLGEAAPAIRRALARGADAEEDPLLRPNAAQRLDEGAELVTAPARGQREHRAEMVAARVGQRRAVHAAQPGLDALGDRRPVAAGGHSRRLDVHDHVAAAKVEASRLGTRLGDVHRPDRERVEEIANRVLGRKALDELRLLERQRHLVAHCLEELGVLVGEPPAGSREHEQHAELLPARHERGREDRGTATLPRGAKKAPRAPTARPRAAAAQQLEQRSALVLGERLGVEGEGGGRLQPAAVGVGSVQLARLAAQQPAHASRDHPVEVLVPADSSDLLAEGGKPGQGVDSLARLLVQARVLDRTGDERRRVDKEVEHPLVELARRRGMHDDDADDLAGAPGDRHGGHRLEALLLELGDVLHARVGERVVADEGGLVVARHPACQPLVEPELDATDEVRVDP